MKRQALTRDGRDMVPYPLNAYQVQQMPLTCLWFELRWHGFGPFENLEGAVAEALRGAGTFDFYELRQRIPELAGAPKPTVAPWPPATHERST